MTTDSILPPLRDIYAQAQADAGPVPDDAALDRAARKHGFDTWAELEATAGVSYRTFGLGTPVEGKYLGHDFTGVVKGAGTQSLGRTRLNVAFDEPLDVSATKAFAVLRRRVSATVDRFGDSAEKTSDGVPQMQLWLRQG